MAYQLPPPPHHDDPNVRAWLFEVWKRNQDILDSSATIQITGDVTAPATGSTNKQFVLPSTLNLDLICAIDGGDSASTYTGADFPFHSIYGKSTIDTSPLSASWTEIERIYDLQTDGTNILIVGKKATAGTYHVWSTDHTLATVTEVVEYDVTNFPGWDGTTWLEHIEYLDTLGRWVVASPRGHLWYSDDTGATWTECTYPASWNTIGANICHMFWNTDLGYLYVGGPSYPTLPISTDGITFVDQDTQQALPSPHQDKLHWASTLEYGTSKVHILSHWETYSWKDEDTGGSTGWTKTTNNGVLGGAGGLWTIGGWACDGTTTVVKGFSSISVNADPTIHANWVEYDWVALGLASNYNIIGILYIPELDRPWVMAVDDTLGADTRWFDAPTITTGGAPDFQPATTPVLSGKGLPWVPTNHAYFGGRIKTHFGNNWAIVFRDTNHGGTVDSVSIGRVN